MTRKFLVYSFVCLVSFLLVSSSLCTCTKEEPSTPSSSSAVVKGKATTVDESEMATNSDSAAKKILQEFIEFDGKPILVDLGSTSCVPCIEMKPILEDLQKNYSPYFHTLFIDVNQDPEVSRSLGVQFIPTQIFFDGEGIEKYRHVGFFSKEDILSVLAMNGCDVRDK
ncbi:MAG TPA: thioredoxin family protein [Caldisericia bacterium]|nr:thioredoxin family protein [Caldisericia bacterium]HXK52064.1 thioredoxin family protein [Caldisericia bacterium]